MPHVSYIKKILSLVFLATAVAELKCKDILTIWYILPVTVLIFALYKYSYLLFTYLLIL